MAMGSAPVSRGSPIGVARASVSRSLGSSTSGIRVSSSRSTSPSVYADNAYNRSIGRAGLPKGSARVSSNTPVKQARQIVSASWSTSPTGTARRDVYKDNAYNRSIGRVGLPRGSAPVSSNTPVKYGKQIVQASIRSGSVKTYVDNPRNRKLNRVGKPWGTGAAPNSPPASSTTSINAKTYVNNALNRKLGRVGKPLGSQPQTRVIHGELASIVSEAGLNPDEIIEMLLDVHGCVGSMESASETISHFDTFVGALKQRINPQKAAQVAQDLGSVRAEMIRRKAKAQVENTTLDNMLTLARTAQASACQIPHSHVKWSLRDKIGSGAHADVYTGTYNGTIVAVRVMRGPKMTKKIVTDIAREVNVLGHLEHPNIVKLFGVCIDPTGQLPASFVMELVPDGSVHDVIHSYARQALSIGDLSDRSKIDIALGAAEGIAYLHDHQIFHRDIKPANLLLARTTQPTMESKASDSSVIAKWCDFGFSRVRNHTESSASCSINMAGTWRYMSPELLRGEKVSCISALGAADIWAFGVTLLELFTEEPPLDGMTVPEIQRSVGRKGYIPTAGVSTHSLPKNVQIIIESCLSPSSRNRPSAREIVASLKSSKPLKRQLQFSILNMVFLLMAVGAVYFAMTCLSAE